jgi:hypothetical protein
VRYRPFGTTGVQLFGLRIAAHSSLQEVFEPWQLAAMPSQSSLQSECRWTLLATQQRKETVGGTGPASALRLCYEKASKGVWRTCALLVLAFDSL